MKPPPEVGEVVVHLVEHNSIGNRYIVLKTYPCEIEGQWCVVDLMNARTQSIFRRHRYSDANRKSVEQMTDKEAVLFALWTLTPERFLTRIGAPTS